MVRVFLATFEVYLEALIKEAHQAQMYPNNSLKGDLELLVDNVCLSLEESTFLRSYSREPGKHKDHIEFISSVANPFSQYILEFVKPDLIELESGMSERCAYVMKHGRVVNPSGYLNTHFPVDLSIEFMNRDFKLMAPPGTSTSDAPSNRIAMGCSEICQCGDTLFNEFRLTNRAGNILTKALLSQQKNHSSKEYQVECIDESGFLVLANKYIPDLILKRKNNVLDVEDFEDGTEESEEIDIENEESVIDQK
ncbi:hypothetical protein BDR26DRAFT_959158 [Obelidium mucronatum]|nr:hypothetical protein BDR26DRAFT_959158 [Obelidium mucronatum]